MNVSSKTSTRLGQVSLFALSTFFAGLITASLLPYPAFAGETTATSGMAEDHTAGQPELKTFREHSGKAGTFMIVLPHSLRSTRITDGSSRFSEGVLFDGVEVYDVTFNPSARGDQLVIFGRYESSGRAHLRPATGDTGYPNLLFPAFDPRHPEIERLWAYSKVERLRHDHRSGLLSEAAASAAIEDLTRTYDLVQSASCHDCGSW